MRYIRQCVIYFINASRKLRDKLSLFFLRSRIDENAFSQSDNEQHKNTWKRVVDISGNVKFEDYNDGFVLTSAKFCIAVASTTCQ